MASPPSPLRDLPARTFTTLQKVKPVGALQARKQASGAVGFYWRYSIGKMSERVSIGLYDPSAPPKSLTPTKTGYSLAAAVRAAESLALEHHGHRDKGGRPALVAIRNEASLAESEEKRRAASSTLEKLLAAYCDHLQSLGRRSHKDARSIFNLHVVAAWPEVATRPAAGMTPEEIADMMRRLTEAGKDRTANKLRSYIRAAFQTAKAARTKASIPVEFKDFGITSNPASDTMPDETANRANKDPMSLEELRTYWRLIKQLDGFKGSLLRFHLLTGGQRIEQLVNLRTENVHRDYVVIHDGKGRPGKPPREHWIPLIREARKALDACGAGGLFALSTDGGATHISATTLSSWARTAVAAQIKRFQAKRIRSGIETLLASAGVTQEVRGRLQSHGVSGVQQRHYNGHDYLDQKRLALEALYALLEKPSGTVRQGAVRPKRRPVGQLKDD